MTPEMIAIAALILNIITALVGLTWGLGKVRDTVRQEMRKEHDALRNRFENEMDGLSRVASDGLTALRIEVSRVELAAYKDFIRRDSFLDIMDRVSKEISAYKATIEIRLDRQEGKIDKLIAKELAS